MDKIPSIAHFAAATFFGNVAFSAMGFGMAICYLFIYQVGDIAGVPGLPGLKYAVFVQTIGFTVIQPIVLWNVDLKKNFRIEMMFTMLAMQFVGAPLGLILQEYTPAAILKIIVGVVTILVAAHQIFTTWQARKRERAAAKYEMVEVEGEEKEASTAPVGTGEEEQKNGALLEQGKEDNGVLVEQSKEDNGVLLEQDKEDNASSTNLSCSATCKQLLKNAKTEMWPIRPVIIWMTLAGLASGFLAGLIGVRSPPLIIFFFIFEYPKSEVRANGTVIAFGNTISRIITYLCTSPGPEYGSEAWFLTEDLVLYGVVAVVALLATPVGLYLTRYLQKAGYKVALTLLLIVNGVTMITTAGLDIASGDIN